MNSSRKEGKRSGIRRGDRAEEKRRSETAGIPPQRSAYAGWKENAVLLFREFKEQGGTFRKLMRVDCQLQNAVFAYDRLQRTSAPASTSAGIRSS